VPNQWTKAKETGIPYIIKDSTRLKLSISAKTGNDIKWKNSDFRKKHSEAMKKAVKQYPDSYTSSNRGRTKQIIEDGIKFQGKWELEFYQYCKINSIEIKRPNEWFEYEWNGIRKYFPDFYLPKLDLYIEVKGYETDRDRAKWKYFPKKLRVIRSKDIKEIRKGCFGGL
jgi:hypothetical protein